MTIVTATSSYLARVTPGVYTTEIDAFGTGIVGVATAVPIFIGYTEFAGDPTTGAPMYNQPVPISSMMEYGQYFGGAAPAGFAVAPIGNPNSQSASGSGASGSGSSSGSTASTETPAFYASYVPATGAAAITPFSLQSTAEAGEITQFNLYWAMQAFFANGGSQCYIVSVGSYWVGQSPTSIPTPTAQWFLDSIGGTALNAGVTAAGYATGPTMTVVPEACLLTLSDYSNVVTAMLSQASVLKDRVAIIDPPGILSANTLTLLEAAQTALAGAIAPAISGASYGAVYAPAINASVVSPSNILYTNLVDAGGNNATINNILTTQATQLYSGAALTSVQAAIATAFPVADKGAQYSLSGTGYPTIQNQTLAEWQLALDNVLLSTLPVFKQIETLVAAAMNILPASPFAAGVWAASDSRNGVWNAPANIALASAVSPLYIMSDAEQGGFNMPVNGQAINIIRAQPGRGNVVWGARTLDGNSLDYRYIQVRRTLIYIEQSIKQALAPYVFAANDSLTWSTVSAAISSFLTDLWQRGGLMGAKPSEAFTVSVGLGSTMTAQDVLNGYMIVAVTLQLIHPAEFIELTFTQTMGS
jgi:phage tail sheath protein FI